MNYCIESKKSYKASAFYKKSKMCISQNCKIHRPLNTTILDNESIVSLNSVLPHEEEEKRIYITDYSERSIKKKCISPDCNKCPSYGHKGEERMYCFSHRKPTMIRLDSRKCISPDCNKGASFGHDGGKRMYCVAHCEPTMIRVDGKKCISPDCNKCSSFGYDGGKRMYCVTHQDPNMIDLTNPKCTVPNCKKYASFGHDGGKRIYCVTHRDPNMISVRVKKRKSSEV